MPTKRITKHMVLKAAASKGFVSPWINRVYQKAGAIAEYGKQALENPKRFDIAHATTLLNAVRAAYPELPDTPEREKIKGIIRFGYELLEKDVYARRVMHYRQVGIGIRVALREMAKALTQQRQRMGKSAKARKDTDRAGYLASQRQHLEAAHRLTMEWLSAHPNGAEDSDVQEYVTMMQQRLGIFAGGWAMNFTTLRMIGGDPVIVKHIRQILSILRRKLQSIGLAQQRLAGKGRKAAKQEERQVREGYMDKKLLMDAFRAVTSAAKIINAAAQAGDYNYGQRDQLVSLMTTAVDNVGRLDSTDRRERSNIVLSLNVVITHFEMQRYDQAKQKLAAAREMMMTIMQRMPRGQP